MWKENFTVFHARELKSKISRQMIYSNDMSSPKRVEGIHYLDNYPVAIDIENGKIVRVERINKLSQENPVFIAPGLIDIQVNGFNSVSFSLDGPEGSLAEAQRSLAEAQESLAEGEGTLAKAHRSMAESEGSLTESEASLAKAQGSLAKGKASLSEGIELTTKKIRSVTEGLWKEGVTTYLPTLTTNSQELLLKNFRTLARSMTEPSTMGSIPGFHLEGPYISSADGYRGAHPAQHVRKPDWNEFLELFEASREKIMLVTLAPEVDNAMEFIRKCREKGIVVSLGHQNGSARIIKEAIDNGAGLATHLGNGCAPLIHRHLNPLWSQLADDRLMISMLCDGFHLPPEVIRVFYKVKGAENIVMASDITSYAGMPPGEYRLKTGESIVKTTDGNLKFSGQEGGLYGSASPLNKGVGHIMKVTGCSLANAIRMAATNPARLLQLHDRGTLLPGKRADIILFTMEDSEMKIRQTIVEGKTVYQETINQ